MPLSVGQANPDHPLLSLAAKHRSVKLRQTHLRVSKRVPVQVGRYAHAKQFQRMRRGLKTIRTRLERVICDIRSKVPESDTARGGTSVTSSLRRS